MKYKLKYLLTIAMLLVSTIVTTMIGTSMETKADTILGTIPVYRLYCPMNGEHLYTTDYNETKVLYKMGWGYEGVAWYACETGTPVYRLYNSGLKNHLYTTDLNEANTLVRNEPTYWHWDNNKKPVFYSNGSIPIYRVYNRGLAGMHHLTTDKNEYNVLPKYGWKQEGCRIYAGSIGAQIKTIYYENNPNLPAITDAPNNNYSGTGYYTIENTDSYAAIEADVKLEGTGTGSHAKLVICTPTAAVSFGLQYDSFAVGAKTMCLIENIRSNNPGGQTYIHPNNQVVNLGNTYHLMLTLNKNGTGSVFLNNKKIGDYNNSSLANQSTVYLRVEGSARIDGDSVKATFSNIKLKTNSTYNASKNWKTQKFITNPTMKVESISSTKIVISGTISGLGEGYDWDKKYNNVSAIIQFVE